jgi:pSer/pThr/pTyr-binding forkhead associated (FHA) protein
LTSGDRLRFDDVELTYQAAETLQSTAWLEMGGRRYPLPAWGASIGRSRESDLHLADERVSRRHALIEPRSGGFVLTDLGSTNGTFVNGRRIRQQPLHDGDEIIVGRSRLRFHIEDGT